MPDPSPDRLTRPERREERNRDFRPAQFCTMLMSSSQAISILEATRCRRLAEFAASLSMTSFL